MTIKQQYRAFTLVELLVVIGIIALLISVLLPALNKARQQANSMACLGNEHQMGLLIAEYEAENKGWLPYGNTGDPNPPQAQYGWGWWNCPVWTWCDTLSIMSSRKTQLNNGQWQYTYSWNQAYVGNKAYDYLGIFHDKDLATDGYAVCASDYAASPRIMPDGNTNDGYFTGGTGNPSDMFCAIRNVGSIRNTANTMMVWCSGVTISASGADQGGAEVGTQVDNGNIQSGVGMVFPPKPAASYGANGNNGLICLGTGFSFPYTGSFSVNPQGTLGDTIQSLRRENTDVTGSAGYFNVSMRFRHMNNTSANMLFVDGHCETRQLGTVRGKDICSSAPLGYAHEMGD